MRIGNEYAAKTLCKAVQACYNFSVYTEDGADETTGRYVCRIACDVLTYTAVHSDHATAIIPVPYCVI